MNEIVNKDINLAQRKESGKVSFKRKKKWKLQVIQDIIDMKED